MTTDDKLMQRIDSMIMKTQGRSRNRLWPVVSGAALIALAGCNGGNHGSDGGMVASVPSGPVATVGGTSISREEFDQFLEANNGDAALRQLIEFEIVIAEAKKDNLAASDADVAGRIQDLRKQSPTISKQVDDITKAGGPRYEALKRQVRYQITLENLITKDIKVDDATLQKWFAANSARYATPASLKIGYLVASTKQRVDTLSGQLKAKTKTFAQLVDDQKKANDPAASQSTADSEVSAKALPPSVQTVVAKLQPGGTTDVMQLTPGIYGIIRLNSRVDAVTPDLKAMQTRVARDYKLEQLARQTVGKNPQSKGFDATVKQIEQYLAQQNMQQGKFTAPSHDEVLGFINQTAVTNLMAKLRTSANVQINDTAYAKVGEEYKPAPGMVAGGPIGPGASPAGGAAAPAGSAPAPPAPAK